MPFSFFKRRTPKPECKLNIQSYNDFAVHCARRKSEGAILNDFSGESIRLIIFKDQYGDICDDRIHDRRVIFDSKCVSIEHASGHQKMTRNQSDHRALLDLVFGNVEMAFRGDCLRIHCTTDPLQLYLSTVFTPTRPRSRESSLSRQNSTSSLASMVVTADDSLCLAAAAAPIPMHLVAQYAKDNQIASDTPALSTSVGTNWLSSLESIRPANSGLSASRSSGNIHQAVSNVSASVGAGNQRSRLCDHLGQKSVSESDSMTSLVSACGRSRRPTRLALCVLMAPFPAEAQAAAARFLSDFFANAAVWELLFFALCREVTDILLNSRHPPVSDVWDLLTRFRRAAVQVTLGPVLPCPAWLAMISAKNVRKELVRRFAADCLRPALLLLNTKNTTFFLSTLLTSVLTHHSSWVRAVVAKSKSGRPNVRCRCRFAQPCNPTRQIHDLFGCVCTGLARVVVLGRDRHLVQLLLHTLSYFMRSGHVRTTEVEADEEGPPDNILPSPINVEAASSTPEVTSEPTKSNSLSDSGLSSQEDLVPLPTKLFPEKEKKDKAGDKPRSSSQTARFCEETENGVLLHLPLAERHYDPPPPMHASEASHCLLGGVLPSYSSAVALQGLCTSSSSYLSTSSSASNVAVSGGWEAELKRDLRHAVAWSGAPYAVGLVADVDSHTVKEVRVEEDLGPEDEAMENAAGPARCVMAMMESAQTFLTDDSTSDWMADACLSSVEHSLSQMVSRARTLWQIYSSPSERLTPADVKRLGIEMSDMALYQNIALADICIQG